jgi:hypothetical protein
LGESAPTKVKVDAEDAILHITDQSIMFERGGRVSGFERSAIRMVKPDGDAMIIAYSAGSEVKSVRVEPMTAVAALLMSAPRSDFASGTGSVPVAATALDETFEGLYRQARKELEDRLVKVEGEPANKNLRLTPEEEKRYVNIRNQMTNLACAKFGVGQDADSNDTGLFLDFGGLKQQPYERQLAVVKINHINFLLYFVCPRAEACDVSYSIDHVWPEDWSRLLKHFSLGNSVYVTEEFDKYVDYLKPHYKHRPDAKKPGILKD